MGTLCVGESPGDGVLMLSITGKISGWSVWYCTCSCQPASTIFALIFPCITTTGGRSRHNLRHRAIDALPKEFYTEHGAAENIKLWLCIQVIQRKNFTIKIHTTIL